MRKYFSSRGAEQESGLERVKILFELANQEFPKHPDRAHRYASMIVILIKRLKVNPPKNIKRFVCLKCSHLLVPGKTLNVKSEDGFLIYSCIECGNVKRYGIGDKK